LVGDKNYNISYKQVQQTEPAHRIPLSKRDISTKLGIKIAEPSTLDKLEDISAWHEYDKQTHLSPICLFDKQLSRNQHKSQMPIPAFIFKKEETKKEVQFENYLPNWCRKKHKQIK